MPLTWRNVAAPDFSASLAGLRTSADLFDRALSTARVGLGRADDRITEQANNEFQNQVLGFQDAGALEAALVNNPDLGRRISGQSRQFAQDQIGTLLGREVDRQNIRQNDLNYDVDSFKFGEAQSAIARQEAAAPLINAAASAAVSGNEQAYNSAVSGLGNSGLRANELLSAFSDVQGLQGGQLDNAGARQNQSQSATRFNWEGADRQVMIQGQALANQILSESADSESALYALERLGSGADPRAVAFARQQVNQQFGNIYAPGGASASGVSLDGGTAGSDSLRIMNYEARASGFNAVPENVKTLGDARGFARQVNDANRRRMGSAGSSAMGIYQITGSTMEAYGKRLWGDDWQNQAFDFESQDALGRAIFEDNNGSAAALKRQWVSLSTAEAEQLRKLPWEQARQLIAQKESNGNPAQISNSTAGIATAAAVSNIGNATGSSNFASRFGQDEAPVAVARALREEMPGVPVDFLTNQISDVVRRSRVDGRATINAGQAADIILRNYTDQHEYRWQRELDFLIGGRDRTPNLGTEGLRLNDDGITQDIERAKRGEFVDLEVEKASTQEAGQSIIQANQQVSALRSRLNLLDRQIAGGRTGLSAERARVLDELQAAIIAQGQITESAAPRIDPRPSRPEQSQGSTPPPSFLDLFKLRGSFD